MDKLIELTDVEKKYYRLHIHSDRLKTLSRECPNHPRVIHGTGEMYLGKDSDRWAVQYMCPLDGELKSWQPDVDAITKQIAADVLGKASIDPSSKG